MTRITSERMAEIKASGKINGIWELLAFIWTFRRREFLGILLIISLSVNIGFLIKYTDVVKYLIQKFM